MTTKRILLQFIVFSACAILATVGSEVTVDFEEANVHLECALDGKVTSWKKDNVTIADFKPYEQLENNTLIVKKAGKGFGGVYTCSNDAGDDTITLNVRPHVKSFDKAKNLLQDDPLPLDCKGYGYPTPVVEWSRNGTILRPGDRITVKDTEAGPETGVMFNGSIRILKLTYDDAGEYKCLAMNEFGAANGTIHVRVKDKYAAVWPFLGICAEVAILCVIIFIYEKRRTKRMQEEENRQAEEAERLNSNNESKMSDDVRQRK